MKRSTLPRTLTSIALLQSLAACGGALAPGAAARSSEMYGAPMPAASAQAVAHDVAAEPSGDQFRDYGVNPFVDASTDKLSTFAIDVDTGSYAFSRRMIMGGTAPSMSMVRAEEFINYFEYGYAPPQGKEPFAVYANAAPSPTAQGHHLVRIGLKGREIDAASRPPVHLTYLIDISGSMSGDDRLGLAKKCLRMLTSTLKQGDTIAITTYAGETEEKLAPTSIDQRERIFSAIDNLSAGGSTYMSGGIDLAYRVAAKSFVKGHTNRVIVLSDGDANVGATGHEEVLKLIKQKKDMGITLSTVGFGNGNFNDTMMEQLADAGDGNYTYIDNETQAKRVFVDQSRKMVELIARDVKVQVEFDPEVVEKYRLIGYENRDVADKDFRNDKVDGGEVGMGHSVTALYDVVLKKTDKSPLTVRIRHKAPDAPPATATAQEMTVPMPAESVAATWAEAPRSMKLAAAVAAFAEKLRQSPHAKALSYAQIESLVQAAGATDADGRELAELVRRAATIAGEKPTPTQSVAGR